MLLTLKAYTQAMRALLYYTAAETDFADHAEDEERRKLAGDRVAVLTPLVKAWCTDLGVDMASLAIQVHGGMGYIEETGVAQLLRDSRIAPIYEGTNGIQAIDLLTRKLPLEDGAVVKGMISDMERLLGELDSHPELESFGTELGSALNVLSEASDWLLTRLSDKDIDDALAGATPYLELFASVVSGWLVARGAVAALSSSDRDSKFNTDWVNTARFYGEHLLPQTTGLLPTIKGGASLLQNAVL
jgi:hypothetical protein